MVLDIVAKNRQSETSQELFQKERVITFQPIAMSIPNSYGVYSPDELRPKKQMNYDEFLSRYATRPRKVRICFDAWPNLNTMVHRSQQILAYNFGLDCWYIVASNSFESDPPQEWALSPGGV